MTGFVARNATETIGFIATEADEQLTKWTVDLSNKYISIPAKIYNLSACVDDPFLNFPLKVANIKSSGAGSDYMSYTKLNYPSAFASEGNPLAGGKFPGEFDPYVHGVRDTMDVDDELGYFSVDVCISSVI